MSNYSANLSIRVDSKGVNSAAQGLDDLERKGQKTERATDGVSASFKRLIAPVAAFISVSAGLNKIIDVTRQYEVFQAQLETATGSAKNASLAFDALEGFASRTPYALEQSVDAFVTLTNLGLKPSERALTSYGDTASAMGKDLTQLIEAVADATTGEFERLKEFGIKSSQEGDKVRFTFKGVTTTVKNSAEEIEQYLIDLGENEFAGNMQKRMQGLDGALSNLQDTWDGVFRSVSNQGIAGIITEGVNAASDALTELNAAIESGQIKQFGVAFSTAFRDYGNDIARTLTMINDMYKEHADYIGDGAEDIGEFMVNAFKNTPANVRALIQIMTVELMSFIDKTSAYGSEILDNLQFWKDESFDLDAALSGINSARETSIEYIFKERDAAISSTDAQIQKANELRIAYDKVQEGKKASLDDIPSEKSKGNDSPITPDASSQKEFEKLINNVIPPAARINEVFESRLKLIEENTVAGSKKQTELIERLNKEYATDVLNGFEVEPGKYDFSEKIALLEEEYQARREIILSNTSLTEEQRTEIEEKLARGRAQKLNAIESERYTAQIGIARSALGNLSTLMNSESRKAFRIGKIAAIANATIAGIEATIHSYKFGASIGGPVLGAAFAATAAAATAVQIQQLHAQQFGGGGTVSATGGGSPGNVYKPEQPTQPVGPQSINDQQRPIQFIFNGNFTAMDAETVATMVKDHVDKTDFVLIEKASRNGQELAA